MFDGHVPSLLYGAMILTAFCVLVFGINSCTQSSHTKFYETMKTCAQNGGSIITRSTERIDCIGSAHKAEDVK